MTDPDPFKTWREEDEAKDSFACAVAAWVILVLTVALALGAYYMVVA
jgi:hypothetical protein